MPQTLHACANILSGANSIGNAYPLTINFYWYRKKKLQLKVKPQNITMLGHVMPMHHTHYCTDCSQSVNIPHYCSYALSLTQEQKAFEYSSVAGLVQEALEEDMGLNCHQVCLLQIAIANSYLHATG